MAALSGPVKDLIAIVVMTAIGVMFLLAGAVLVMEWVWP